MDEEENQTEEISNEKHNLKTVLKIFSVVAIVGMIATFIIIAIYNENFKFWKWALIIGLPFLLISIIIFFMFEISSWFKRDKLERTGTERIPPQRTLGWLYEESVRILRGIDYMVKYPRPVSQGTEQHGKKRDQAIYHFICEDVVNGKKIRYVVLINAHYPDLKKNLLVNPNNYEITKAKQLLAVDSEESPDERKTISKNLLTGTEITTLEKIRRKKEQKKTQKTGDLE